METIRRDIDKAFVGQTITRVQVAGLRSVRRHPDPQAFVCRLVGRKVVGTRRRGKYLLMLLDSHDVVVAHMGMSGQLLRAVTGESRRKHTHVVVSFATGVDLCFVDPRTFGEMFVTTFGALESEIPELAHLGPDPLGLDALGDRVAGSQLAAMLTRRRTKLKPLLMDQRFLAGIGNMYADEILFGAALRPDRPSGDLTPDEVRQLQRSMVETLNEAIEHRGSSLADEQYRDLFGNVGGFQHLHKAYGRGGEACVRCSGHIVRVRSGGRSWFFCEQCQV